MEVDFISVIGGLGGMGARMVEFFKGAGYRVKIADVKAGAVDWESAAQSPVLILAVPIPALEGVLEQLGPHTRVDGVVIDISSVKSGPVEAMLKHCRGEVIGGHPLFGPGIDTLRNQVFFVCPVRTVKWIHWFLDFLHSQQARVLDLSPRDHDRLMSRIQVLRHLLLISFGLSLSRLDFDVQNLLPVSGPWFNNLVEMLGIQLRQGPDLYADLALNNPETGEVMDEFLRAADEIFGKVASRDRNGLVDLISQVSSFINHRQLDPGIAAEA